MSLPKRPPLNNPIPNADIPNIPEQYIVKAPYWDAVVSGNLIVSEDGTLGIDGSTTPPLGETEVQGAYWNMPLGNGLGLWRGEFRTVEPEEPPYGCRTDVITTGVTDFTDAWRDCAFTSFPGDIDTSAGTNFGHSWYYCTNLQSFPNLNVGNGTSFSSSWGGCYGLQSFPALDTSKGENFDYAWGACSSLTTFPPIDTSNGDSFSDTWADCTSLVSFPPLDVSQGTDFSGAWYNCVSLESFPQIDTGRGTNFTGTWSYCQSLTSFPPLDLSLGVDFGGPYILQGCWGNCTSLSHFPANVFDNCAATNFDNAWFNCALSQTSVDNILVSIDTAGQSGGTLTLSGGTSSPPGSAGVTAKASLISRGWTVTTN